MLDTIRNIRIVRKDKQEVPTVDVAIEYVGHKWVISVRNPGQKEWVAHREASRKVQVFNHLNEVVRTVPVVETFASQAVAKQFCDDNMPGHRVVTRTSKEIEAFFTALRKAVQ